MDIGLIAGSGWAAGLNVYAVVLIMGLLGRFTDAAVPEQLTSTGVLIAAGVLYLIEFVADKIPYVDNAWDAIHTVIRPVAAGWIGYLIAGDAGLSEALGAGTAGVTALISHSTKATTRAAVNVSPEPASNTVLSLFEDGLAAGMVALAVTSPVIALILVIILVIAGGWLIFVLWRGVARVWRRIADKTGAPAR